MNWDKKMIKSYKREERMSEQRKKTLDTKIQFYFEHQKEQGMPGALSGRMFEAYWRE